MSRSPALAPSSSSSAGRHEVDVNPKRPAQSTLPAESMLQATLSPRRLPDPIPELLLGDMTWLFFQYAMQYCRRAQISRVRISPTPQAATTPPEAKNAWSHTAKSAPPGWTSIAV
uniref:Uncharacterized protein n=1 Tax=Arundo donax TaxID=35708 RepID=A0A0A9DZB8_ARUDO